MSDFTTWRDSVLYPALFDVIDHAFPEHGFKQVYGDWRSPLKIDLSEPKQRRPDKTVITKRQPTRVLEQGEQYQTLSIIDLAIKTKGFSGPSDHIQAANYLAGIAGVPAYESDSFNPDLYKKQQQREDILEAAQSYFTWCLTNAPGADKARDYLLKRGYSKEELQEMKLGYIPTQEQLVNKLLADGYDAKVIGESLNITQTAIGRSHKISIPFKSGDRLIGFNFRTIGDAETGPKYLNTLKDGDKVKGFFNISSLRGNKDLIVVEGELDALHASAKGVENVVATGGSSINPEQIKDAIRKGAKKITLCFDTETDPGKTERAVKRAIEIIKQTSDLKVYVASLPGQEGGKVDADSYIKEAGVEAFKSVINNAKSYYLYIQETILNKYRAIIDQRGGLTEKETEDLIDEIVQYGRSLPDALERGIYTKQFMSLPAIKESGITEESLNEAQDKLRYKEDEEAQKQEFKSLLDRVNALQSKGETVAAIEVLNDKLKSVQSRVGARLIRPYTFSEWQSDIASAAPAIKTGYEDLDKIIRIPQGAITLVAGRPSHGKTTFMYNLLLKMAQEPINYGKKFYFFSYEEESKYILTKMLNSIIGENFEPFYHEYDVETNYNFLKAYLANRRTLIPSIEQGKELLRSLMESGKIEVIGRGYSVEELSTIITYLNKSESIGAVFIDYIQRMRTDRDTKDKRLEIAHISDRVLDIAKETGLPIILGAQLNRGAAGSGKPTLENLKEAGNLEEDANLVLSVYNESREKDTDESGHAFGREVTLEIKALKNRDGEPNKSASLTFDRWTGVVKDQTRVASFQW